MAASSGKKGGKKIGRNLRKPSCARYKNSARWLTNKIKKLKKHIKNQTNLDENSKLVCNDKSATRALKIRLV